MRKPREFQLGEVGLPHFYHVVSRIAGREILFGDAEREAFMEIFSKQLGFRRRVNSTLLIQKKLLAALDPVRKIITMNTLIAS